MAAGIVVTVGAEHRWRWWKPLSLQVALLGLLTVGVVAAVALVPALLTGTAHRQLSTSAMQAKARLFALERVNEELVKERVTNDEFFATPVGKREAAVGASTAQFIAVESAWRRFNRLTPRLAGETALRAQYASGRATFTTLATESLGVDAIGPTSELVAASRVVQTTVDALSRGYKADLTSTIAVAGRSAAVSMRASIALGAVALVLLAFTFLVVFVAARRRERVESGAEIQRTKDWAQRDLENRLQRGLAMLDTEGPCYTVVTGAVRVAAPRMATELLVADSSQAHFRQVLATDADAPACCVMSPVQCPAASGAQTQLWPSADAIDACPFLREHAAQGGAAACVPVSIAGKTIGVLHATTETGGVLDPDEVAGLELVARQTGERIGVLRAFAQSQSQAHTDPLTGLMNRRSLENAVSRLTDAGAPYVVVFADLDNFKMLNDVHGHETGDRALRLYSRILRDSVRPGDLPARFGGEEFVVVLPDCRMADAVTVIERVQDRLRETTADGSVPAFTASYGLAAGDDVRFDEAVAAADAALLLAKARGRDRLVISGTEPDADVLVAV